MRIRCRTEDVGKGGSQGAKNDRAVVALRMGNCKETRGWICCGESGAAEAKWSLERYPEGHEKEKACV